MTTELSFKPIKRNLWTDFEELFGPHGACAGCWCMFWKLRGKAYDEARGLETRQMHKSIVDSGTVTGLLAYLHGDVVGWVAVEPRSAYEKLLNNADVREIEAKVRELGASAVVTTAKDAMRLERYRNGLTLPWAILPLSVFVEPSAEFEAWLLQRL